MSTLAQDLAAYDELNKRIELVSNDNTGYSVGEGYSQERWWNACKRLRTKMIKRDELIEELETKSVVMTRYLRRLLSFAYMNGAHITLDISTRQEITAEIEAGKKERK